MSTIHWQQYDNGSLGGYCGTVMVASVQNVPQRLLSTDNELVREIDNYQLEMLAGVQAWQSSFESAVVAMAYAEQAVEEFRKRLGW